MRGLVPRIHVFFCGQETRGWPEQVRPWRTEGAQFIHVPNHHWSPRWILDLASRDGCARPRATADASQPRALERRHRDPRCGAFLEDWALVRASSESRIEKEKGAETRFGPFFISTRDGRSRQILGGA